MPTGTVCAFVIGDMPSIKNATKNNNKYHFNNLGNIIMAQRCFDSFNVVLSASERSSKKRNTTIYTEIQKNVQRLNTANPIKQNGFYYNKNS